MRTLTGLFVAILTLTSLGCSYGAVASHNGKLYVARNDNVLMGVMRKMYECTPDGAGNMTCVETTGRP